MSDQPTTDAKPRYATGEPVPPITQITERIPIEFATRTRTDKWLRALGLVALTEAIAIMTAAIVLGFLAVIAGASILNNLGDTTPAADTTVPGIDPGAGSTQSEWDEYVNDPAKFCASDPGNALCP